MDAMNPRLLSNNLLIPYITAVWEEYFRSTFAATLTNANKREAVLKQSRLSHVQLEEIAVKKKPIEETISECFSFQRPSVIGENFKMLDSKLDIAAALRKSSLPICLASAFLPFVQVGLEIFHFWPQVSLAKSPDALSNS